MVKRSTSVNSEHRLARQARERFVKAMEDSAVDIMMQVQNLLSSQVGGGIKVSISEMQLALETTQVFQVKRQRWAAAVRKAWREALERPASGGAPIKAGKPGSFELVDDTVLERKIAASRLAAAASEAAGEELTNLKLRIQSLEQTDDWPSQDDVLRPDTLALELIKTWSECELTQPMWALAQPAIQSTFSKHMADAYRVVNEFLVENGVMPKIDLTRMMRRGGGGSSGMGGGPSAAGAYPQDGQTAYQTQTAYPAPPQSRHAAVRTRHAGAGARGEQTYYGPQTGVASGYVHQTALARAAQETRMMTSITPMARIRERAQGVLGQLRRLLGGSGAESMPAAPSPRLASALAQPDTPFPVTDLLEQGPDGTRWVPSANVQMVATRLRRRASELKAKADTPSEKAIIEIVALMFQAILAEERIPAAIRVWFARLQMPVLRVALAEPDFFASVEHPARQLIDRMGGCALGFDTSQIEGSQLEREVKRIVQVIEQYPETGRRVYELVLDEFKQFLGNSLAGDGAVKQAATLAQQVEQKEALSIQYTIELRRMLDPVPVSEDVREFLLRVWSDVLALATVRHGARNAETLRFKQAAADLLWSVSPRSDRAERSRVVQKLAGLITVLREGMSTLAISDDEQNGHVKIINEAIVQAFASRAEGISQATLNDLAMGLAGLEDVVTDDPEGDVLLDPGMIELMFDVQGGALEVISTGGSMPGEGMLQWARELELGSWFELDHQGALSQVQYVWRSARKQLHLLANRAGKTYLVQTRRLASYLQAGLLVPVEDEALTVRATRAALARLKLKPDQLLQ